MKKALILDRIPWPGDSSPRGAANAELLRSRAIPRTTARTDLRTVGIHALFSRDRSSRSQPRGANRQGDPP